MCINGLWLLAIRVLVFFVQVHSCTVIGLMMILTNFISITVEPSNEGHLGSGDFVFYLEAVLWWEVRITIVSTRVIPISAVASVLYIKVNCPLVGGSIIGGSTVLSYQHGF